jgi:hypothetical protein
MASGAGMSYDRLEDLVAELLDPESGTEITHHLTETSR